MPHRVRRGAGGLAVALAPAALCAYVACGNRTGLDVPRDATAGSDEPIEPGDPTPDATAEELEVVDDVAFEEISVPPTFDATVDATLDAPPEAAPDAGTSLCYTQSVLTLATNQDAWSVIVDGTYLYWTNDSPGELRRVPTHGGKVETVAALQNGLMNGFALDSTEAYFGHWDGNDGGPLVRVAKDGGTAVTLATAFYGMGIALDATNVYWTEVPGNQDPGTIRVVPKDGGASSLLTSANDPPTFVREDGGYLYYTWWGTTGGVSRMPSQGGTPTVLALVGYAYDIEVDATDVYFTSKAPTNGGIWRVPKQGGTATQLVQDTNAEQLALDGAWVYYTDFSNVRKVPKSGGAYVDVAPGQTNVRGIAVDADCAYWSNDPIVGEIRVGPK